MDDNSPIHSEEVEKIEDNEKSVESQKLLIKSILAIVAGLGVAIGFVAASNVVNAGLCGMNIMNKFMGAFSGAAGAGAGGGAGANPLSGLGSQFNTCFSDNMFGPLRVICGLLGGTILGYIVYGKIQPYTEENLFDSFI